jgi:hypothetical protein
MIVPIIKNLIRAFDENNKAFFCSFIHDLLAEPESHNVTVEEYKEINVLLNALKDKLKKKYNKRPWTNEEYDILWKLVGGDRYPRPTMTQFKEAATALNRPVRACQMKYKELLRD